MFNKTVDRLKDYALGVGTPGLYQNIADYGTAAALGVAGQQGANWLMGGADPNPLISGALMAPFGTSLVRAGRSMIDPRVRDINLARNDAIRSNPYEQSAYIGSMASLLGGGLTSAQNIAFGGNDIDNNIPASIFAAAAPLTAYLMNKRKGSTSAPKPPAQTPPSPSNSPGFGYKGEGFSDLFNELEDIKNKFYNR